MDSTVGKTACLFVVLLVAGTAGVPAAEDPLPWRNINPSKPFKKLWDTTMEDRDGVHVVERGWVVGPYMKSAREITPLYLKSLGEEAAKYVQRYLLRREMEELLFVETQDHRLYAVESDSGVIKWIVSFPRRIQYPPWVGPKNIYLTSNEVLYAVDRQYGLLAWRKPLSFPVSASPVMGEVGLLFLPSWENRVFCLDTAEMRIKWQFRVGGDIVATPGYAEGLLYVPCEDGTLYCVKGTGELNFAFPTKGPLRTAPCVEKGFVVVASNDNSVYCLNRYNGDKVWECRIGRPLREAPKVVRTTVFIRPYRRGITAISLVTGRILWEMPYTDKIVGYGKRTVYLYTGEYKRKIILGVDQETGEIRWVWDPARTFGIEFDYPLENVKEIHKVFLVNAVPGGVIAFREKGVFEKKEWEKGVAVAPKEEAAEKKKEKEKKKGEKEKEKKKKEEEDLLKGLDFLKDMEQ